MAFDQDLSEEIDPDPFTIANLAIQAASFVLQLLQYGRSESTVAEASQTITHLSKLETAVENVSGSLKILDRTVSRGAADVETQFYAAPLRIGQTSLQLDRASHMQFRQEMLQAHSRIGALGMWINQIIAENPSLARHIGQTLAMPLANVPSHLNGALETGAPIRTVLSETNHVLRVLARAIESELNKGN